MRVRQVNTRSQLPMRHPVSSARTARHCVRLHPEYVTRLDAHLHQPPPVRVRTEHDTYLRRHCTDRLRGGNPADARPPITGSSAAPGPDLERPFDRRLVVLVYF